MHIIEDRKSVSYGGYSAVGVLSFLNNLILTNLFD